MGNYTLENRDTNETKPYNCATLQSDMIAAVMAGEMTDRGILPREAVAIGKAVPIEDPSHPWLMKSADFVQHTLHQNDEEVGCVKMIFERQTDLIWRLVPVFIQVIVGENIYTYIITDDDANSQFRKECRLARNLERTSERESEN